jgi:glycosyltransferase involved in cell wall biosynthesis
MVGSLESSKDYPCLLKAWRLVEERGDFELVIAGGGSKMAEYKEQAVRLGLRKVTFLGVVRDIPSLLWTSRVFAFSARPEEGFGTVLIEALAAGCRVVASDVPGCREVLQAGKCGMLVVPGSPSSFADALIDALSRPAAPAEVAEARDYARGFSPEKMVSEYLRLSGHGRPAL